MERALAAVGRIQELLGGEALTGALHNERDIVRLIRRGVPTQAVEHFLKVSGITFHSLDPHILTRRTFEQRKEAGQGLECGASDRFLRIVSVVALAQETFSCDQKAQLWLHRVNKTLDNETPLGMADTEQGTRVVEALLGHIAHGIAA